MRIDHRSKCLSFGTDLCVSQKEDVPEGPYLQSMPSEQIRNQLTYMAQALHKAAKIIKPTDTSLKQEDLRAHIVQSYRQTAKKDHQRILMRRQIIEERKEELENMNTARVSTTSHIRHSSFVRGKQHYMSGVGLYNTT